MTLFRCEDMSWLLQPVLILHIHQGEGQALAHLSKDCHLLFAKGFWHVPVHAKGTKDPVSVD